MKDDEFWSATDQLNLIYRWARASYVAPWGLLFGVLLRVAASTSPGVMLPGPPAPASLNQGVVFVGRSGAGKGVADKLSRVVWPASIHEEGLGSGQGIAELFKEQKNPEDRITRAIISVSEIDHLSALNSGQGNNTRAALKAALTGDRLGSKGASAPTTRSVPADSYRLGLSISAQFGHTDVLMQDVTGGTPQRMLWAPVTDPDMPDEPGPAPDRVLDTALPPWALSERQTLIQYGPAAIREYVNAGLLANGRGLGEAIDGHRTLTRLKVAADLAILDHRSVVSELDWLLSDVIMTKSDETRNAVLEYDRQAARAKVRDKAISRVTFEEMIDDRHAKTVRSRILHLLTTGPMPRGELRRAMGKQHYREAFDEVLPHLEKICQVIQIPGEKAPHYKLNPEFTGEPEFTPENASSGGVNQEFTGEPAGNVTELHSRRSPEVHKPTLSAPKWLNNHLAMLRAQGHQTADSLAVYQAGEAEGHKIAALRSAASNNSTITVVDRSGGTSTWDITGTTVTGYQPAADWVATYLEALPVGAEIDKAAFQAAAAANKHSWTAARHAAIESGRIESTMGASAVWIRVDPGAGDDGVSA